MRTHHGRAPGAIGAAGKHGGAWRARLFASGRAAKMRGRVRHTPPRSCVRRGMAARGTAASTPARVAAETVAARVVATMRAAVRAAAGWGRGRRQGALTALQMLAAISCTHAARPKHSAAEARRTRAEEGRGAHREPSRTFVAAFLLCTARGQPKTHPARGDAVQRERARARPARPRIERPPARTSRASYVRSRRRPCGQRHGQKQEALLIFQSCAVPLNVLRDFVCSLRVPYQRSRSRGFRYVSPQHSCPYLHGSLCGS